MMKKFASSPLSHILPQRSRSISTLSPSSSSPILSESELTTISTLIHHLCNSDHHPTAIRLLSTALLASPPLSSLPIPFLTHHLTSLPSLSPSFSLLTTLRHHHPPSLIPFFSNLLISSYLHKRRLHDAAKVFQWLCREDSPCRPDAETYRIYIDGLCGRGEGEREAVEVVKVVREMVVRDGMEIGEEMRGLVWSCLVREARVEEAMELDKALGSEGDGVGIGELIEKMIKDWED